VQTHRVLAFRFARAYFVHSKKLRQELLESDTIPAIFSPYFNQKFEAKA
jgi:hypothetical protein